MIKTIVWCASVIFLVLFSFIVAYLTFNDYMGLLYVGLGVCASAVFMVVMQMISLEQVSPIENKYLDF